MNQPEDHPPSGSSLSCSPSSDFAAQLGRLKDAIPCLQAQAASSQPPPQHIQDALDMILRYNLSEPPQTPGHSPALALRTPSTSTSTNILPSSLTVPTTHTGRTAPSTPTRPRSSASSRSQANTPTSVVAQHSRSRSPIPYGPTNGIGAWPYNLLPTIVGYDIDVGRLKLDLVYCYESPDSILEHPETSPRGIGHMMRMDLEAGQGYNRTLDLAYSLGGGSAFSSNNIQRIPLLVDDNGEMVDCVVLYKDCQGIKACAMIDQSLVASAHSAVSRDSLRDQLNEFRLHNTLPSHHDVRLELVARLRERTLYFYQSVLKTGCCGPPGGQTVRNESEETAHQGRLARLEKARRGHHVKPTCDGRILFCEGDKPFIKCEYYSRSAAADHLIDMSVSDGRYDIVYLKALMTNDQDAIEDFEEQLKAYHQLGPLTACKFTMNCSSVRVHCPFPHRDEDGNLIDAEMVGIDCSAQFRLYKPVKEHQERCPWQLLVGIGIHSHPIPPPTRTPHMVEEKLSDLLESLLDDLPDLTPRRLSRHPTTRAFLSKELSIPIGEAVSLSDLHPSLSNMDHVRNYITRAQGSLFPEGTEWAGLLDAKRKQDASETQTPYIRYMATVTLRDNDKDSADELEPAGLGNDMLVAICQTPESSRAYLSARYIQCDTSFKRVKGFYELETGMMDPVSNIGRALTRVYVTRQNAFAHSLIFRKIAEIVKLDTGEDLKWRHLHSPNLRSHTGICLVNVDQHGGQARGLGDYLAEVAASLPEKGDLHEQRTIQSLDAYDHLRRMIRLCTNHVLRNIQKTATTDNIKQKMRSLICLEHPNWDETIAEIRAEGGEPAIRWVEDKIRSKFAFPAMSREKSFIPDEIWRMGERTTNLIEALHADANREGVACSLLGGYLKGLRFDLAKEKTSKVFVDQGILPSYRISTEGTRIDRSRKRKMKFHRAVLHIQDNRITSANARLKKALENRIRKEKTLRSAQESGDSARVEKARSSLEKAQAEYDRASLVCQTMQHTGSGNVSAGVI